MSKFSAGDLYSSGDFTFRMDKVLLLNKNMYKIWYTWINGNRLSGEFMMSGDDSMEKYGYTNITPKEIRIKRILNKIDENDNLYNSSHSVTSTDR